MADVDFRAFFKGVGRTKGALDSYMKEIERNALDACLNLALEAQDEAETNYDNYEGPDGNTVYVTSPTPVREDGKTVGYQIEAKGVPVYTQYGAAVGNTVVFEEFGSGLLAGSHPKSTWFPGIYPGSWSETYGTGEYANYGRWHYGGEEYVYIAPTYAMYLAGQKVRELQGREMEEAFR